MKIAVVVEGQLVLMKRFPSDNTRRGLDWLDGFREGRQLSAASNSCQIYTNSHEVSEIQMTDELRDELYDFLQ